MLILHVSRNRTDLSQAHSPCRSHIHHWQIEQRWSFPGWAQKLSFSPHHLWPLQSLCRSSSDLLQVNKMKENCKLKSYCFVSHYNILTVMLHNTMQKQHFFPHTSPVATVNGCERFSGLPSVSGNSLYPTLFLSTGTTIPEPWNVLATTYRQRNRLEINKSFVFTDCIIICDPGPQNQF